MVRLKGFGQNTNEALNMFQFLMVRLKVIRKLPRVSRKEPVSIPYGTIKRTTFSSSSILAYLFQFLMVRLKGEYASGMAIYVGFQFLMVRLKVYRPSTISTIAKFQFLMVRLKDCTLCRKRRISQVSIPYGTIKRAVDEPKEPYAKLFQFLMVRLKGIVM